MAGIDPARLNKRVTIEVEHRTSNGQGGYNTTWSPLRDVWAEIIGLSGDEALAAGIARNVQQWRVTIRRRTVSTKNRLSYGGRVFNIRSVMPDPKAEDATVLICETTAAAPLT